MFRREDQYLVSIFGNLNSRSDTDKMVLAAVFWEEGGSQPFNPKITITRPLEASLPAFIRHFEDLLETYPQPPVKTRQILNLLSREKEGEASLTRSYLDHLKKAKEVDENIGERVEWTEFDFHLVSRMVGGIERVRRAL